MEKEKVLNQYDLFYAFISKACRKARSTKRKDRDGNPLYLFFEDEILYVKNKDYILAKHVGTDLYINNRPEYEGLNCGYWISTLEWNAKHRNRIVGKIYKLIDLDPQKTIDEYVVNANEKLDHLKKSCNRIRLWYRYKSNYQRIMKNIQDTLKDFPKVYYGGTHGEHLKDYLMSQDDEVFKLGINILRNESL